MNELKNKDGKRNGLITTLLVHACLLILCFFLGFTYYIPAKGTIGMDISGVGFPDAGKNNDPATAEKVSDQTQEQQTPKTTSSAAQENDFANQQNSEVAINKGDQKAKKQPTEKIKPKEPTKPVQETQEPTDKLKESLAALNGPSNPDGPGTGPEAGPEGPIGPGPPGSGPSGQYDFGTRSTKGPGKLEHPCKNRGAVNVRIYVASSGAVTKAEYVNKGSTTSVQCLIDKAIEVAKAMVYTAKPDVPMERHVIRLNFELR